MTHYCPYCYTDMPSGYEPAQWAHCGEVGHAVDAEFEALTAEAITTRAYKGRPITAEEWEYVGNWNAYFTDEYCGCGTCHPLLGSGRTADEAIADLVTWAWDDECARGVIT